MPHYKITYHREMEIDANSIEEAMRMAIDEVGDDYSDSCCYTVAEDKPKKPAVKKNREYASCDDVDTLLAFMADQGIEAEFIGNDNKIVGTIGPFSLDVKINEDVYCYNVYADGNLPNCPERSTGTSYKGTDSINVAKLYIKKYADEWRKKNP